MGSVTEAATGTATQSGPADDARTSGDDERRSEARRAVLAVLPMLLGYLPFGLVIGARVGDGDGVLARWLGTVLIMGGSAHLTVLELLDDGASVALVVGSGLLVNARLVAYSASLAPEWAGSSRRFRAVAGASIIDPTWMLAERRRGEGGSRRDRRTYYAAAAATLCTGWCAIVTVGALVGAASGLRSAEVVLPLCLLALLVPRLARRCEWLPLAAAALVGWFAADLSPGLGVALAAAVAAGFPVASRNARRTSAERVEGSDRGGVR